MRPQQLSRKGCEKDYLIKLSPLDRLRRQTRSGELVLSMVDGVEQLETYFGQYLPQLLISVLTPLIIFAFVAFLDLPVALIFLLRICVLFAPSAWHKFDIKRSKERQQAYETFASDFLMEFRDYTSNLSDKKTQLTAQNVLTNFLEAQCGFLPPMYYHVELQILQLPGAAEH